ncbi:MAG: YeeE/YedE thiosulfate transporter family protein [Ilumatobacteraceae bacterium]
MITGLIASGLASGVLIGAVLRRSDLCFHAMFRGAWSRRTDLLATWLLAVAIGSVGLCLVFAIDPGSGPDLTRGLAFDPVSNIVGGIVIGLGMVVARSGVSGLFYKLGAGMLGALAGLLGWFLGDLAVRNVDLPGSNVLRSGDAGTVPHLIHVPRIIVTMLLLAGVLWWVARRPSTDDATWDPRLAGPALGVALVVAWALAGWAGAMFGPAAVGAPTQLYDKLRYDGLPNWWLLAFLGGLVVGSLVVSSARGQLRARGETPARYAQLVVGGVLLGAGGRIGAGDNLDHGLSGVALLSVSSWVVVLAMAGGVGLGILGERALGRAGATWRASTNEERDQPDDAPPSTGSGGAGVAGSRVAALATGGWAKFTQPSRARPKTPSDLG